MMRSYQVLLLIFCVILLASCSETEKLLPFLKDDETLITSRHEYEVNDSFPAIQQVGELYIMIDQTYEIVVNQPQFPYIPRGVHMMIANPTDEPQSLEFLKELVHQYEGSDEVYHMSQPLGLFDDDFPTTLDAGKVISTYYVYYWPSFEHVYDDGTLTFTVFGEGKTFDIPEISHSISSADISTNIYQFTRQNKHEIQYKEPTKNLETVGCSQHSTKLKECMFDREKGRMASFTLQDGTQYVYPTENSVGKITTLSKTQTMLIFYFDESGLIRIETEDGEPVKITPELLIVFTQLEEMAKFVLQFAYSMEENTQDDEVDLKERLSAKEAEQVIVDFIRPTWNKIENAINNKQIHGTTEQNSTNYQLDQITRIVKDYGDHKMSATYQEGELIFILRIDRATEQLTRYYFYDDQLIRIIWESGEIVHYEDTPDQQGFVELEKQLLNEFK